MKVTKQEIIDIRKRLKNINLCPLEEIETDFEVSQELKDFWKYLGLNQWDLFLMAIDGYEITRETIESKGDNK